MKLPKQKIQRFLRDSGLLTVVNGIRYFFNTVKYYGRGKVFRSRYPGFKVPPRALAFDAYSASDWDFYKKSGEETAAFLAAIVNRYLPKDPPPKVLEWGCGPARVVRHLPTLLGAQVYGTDYNPQTIAWCTPNIPDVTFAENGLVPPLPFGDNVFDFVYSISVFTHLSEPVSQLWAAELLRILRPGGVLAVSTNGDAFRPLFFPDEQAAYDSRGVMVRGNFEEGKKLFLAYHSPEYLRETLFKDFEPLEYVPAGFPFTGQDLSVLRKR